MKNKVLYVCAVLWICQAIPFAVSGYPRQIDDPDRPWCYLAKSTTVIGVPFMPEAIAVTWDGAIYTQQAELCFFYGKDSKPVMQRQKTWLDGWIPLVQYDWQEDSIQYEVEIYNIPLDSGDELNSLTFANVDIMNVGSQPTTAYFAAAVRGSGEDFRTGKPPFQLNWDYVIEDDTLMRDGKLVYTFPPGAAVEAVAGTPYQKPFKGSDYQVVTRSEVGLAHYTMKLRPGQSRKLCFKMPRVPTADGAMIQEIHNANPDKYRSQTIAYWQELMADTCVIDVPEKRIEDSLKAMIVHALLGTRTRHGERFQTDGIPYPNCFISTVFDYGKVYDSLGLSGFTRTFVKQLQKRQRPDGMFLDTSLTHGNIILSSHGQSLMGLANNILFTRDREFGDSIFPMIEKAVACIAKDHRENQYGLMRPSIPYDNEMIKGHYTSHNLWCLAALKRAICVADFLGKDQLHDEWMKLHASYEKAVLKAIDASANEDGYVPTGLYPFTTGPDARAGFAEYRTDQDWENVMLAWPTEVLEPTDRRVTGTTKRFRDTKYREGIMTYRNGQHLHQYITTNIANQDIVAGNTRAALLDIYHILLHGGSTYEGYENQVVPWSDRLVHGAQPPHCWGASKIAGMIRNMFVMEHGGKLGIEPDKRNLYLFSVVSPAWVQPGQTISVKNAQTEFGTVSAYMTFNDGGATVNIEKEFHSTPGQLIVRIPYFVKNVSVATDAKRSSRKGTAVYLSSDATTVNFKWKIDLAVNKNTYQDLLLSYRREPDWWKGRRDQMPPKPKGFLTEQEKAHSEMPLSFELVQKAFLDEYNRRSEPIELNGLGLMSAQDRQAEYREFFGALSLTTGKPVTCSGSMGGHGANLVNDGVKSNTQQYWEADNSKGPAWWMVDLEKPTDICKLVVVPYYGSSRYYQYTVEMSLDGKKWVTLIDQSRNTTPVSKKGYSFEFQPTTVRYIRVNMLKNSDNPGLHLVEVMAYDE